MAGYTPDSPLATLVVLSSLASEWLLTVSIVPYLWLIVTLLLRWSTLKSPFFALVLATAVGDLVLVVAANVPKRNTEIELYHTYHVIARTFGNLIGAYGMLTMGVNRYTAVMMPFRHKVLWSWKTTSLCILCQYTAAVAGSFWHLLPCCHVLNSRGFVLATEEWTHIYFAYQFVHNCFILTPIVLVLYACIVRKVRATLTQNSDARVARGLALIAALTTLPFIFSNGVYVLRVGFGIGYPYAAFFKQVGTNLFACVTPYLLIGMSKQVRAECISVLKFWQKRQSWRSSVTPLSIQAERAK